MKSMGEERRVEHTIRAREARMVWWRLSSYGQEDRLLKPRQELKSTGGGQETWGEMVLELG